MNDNSLQQKMSFVLEKEIDELNNQQQTTVNGLMKSHKDQLDRLTTRFEKAIAQKNRCLNDAREESKHLRLLNEKYKSQLNLIDD